jgi:hypothetical protein
VAAWRRSACGVGPGGGGTLSACAQRAAGAVAHMITGRSLHRQINQQPLLHALHIRKPLRSSPSPASPAYTPPPSPKLHPAHLPRAALPLRLPEVGDILAPRGAEQVIHDVQHLCSQGGEVAAVRSVSVFLSVNGRQ